MRPQPRRSRAKAAPRSRPSPRRATTGLEQTNAGAAAAAAAASRPALNLPQLQRKLLAWYDVEQRPLPWRANRDPYRVWISEVMCQQTRAEVAAPAFERFVAAFPDVTALAAAEEDAVLSLWSGLGYYSRARALRRAAQQLRDAGYRTLPDDPSIVSALPGIGPYSLAAILSIAHGQALAAVDGNVVRVLSRLRRLGRPDARGRPHRELAMQLLDRDRPGDWNQALMELGARLCTPRAPRCVACPIAPGCDAHAARDELSFPPPKPRRQKETLGVELEIVRDQTGRILLERGGFALLSHLWLPPARLLDTPPEDFDLKHQILHRELRVVVKTRLLSERDLLRQLESAAPYVERQIFKEEELATIGRSSLLTKALQQSRD